MVRFDLAGRGMKMRAFAVFAATFLTACTAADVETPQPLARDTGAALWSFDQHEDALRAQSCPETQRFERATEMPIRVIEAELGPDATRDRYLTGLELAGAWQLKAEATEFGGLSGLDVLRSGSLLAISDSGAFVWIGVDRETGRPDGIGSIARMRGADGEVIKGKLDADAEGLSFRDGLALVSFERDHRIEAFDLERCGAGARAARLVDLEPVVEGTVIDENRGAEALALSDDLLLAGFEMRKVTGSPVSAVREDGALALSGYTTQPLSYLMTGLDQQGSLTANLFRAYDPAFGSRAIVQVIGPTGEIALAELQTPLPVDNFEGVAIGTNPSGGTRIWLISDDNFSVTQRTLLLALDVTN